MDRMDIFRGELRAASILREESPLSSVLNFLLLSAIPLAYILQYNHIKKRQSIYGISFFFLIIRAIGTTINVANVLLIGPIFSITRLCWTDYSGSECVGELIWYGQYIADWICSQAILFLCLRYFQDPAIGPPATIRPADVPLSDGQGEPLRQSPSRTAKRIAIRGVRISYIAIFGPYLFFILSFCPQTPPWDAPSFTTSLLTWWLSMTVLAGIFSLVAFIPQIYHTWTLKRVGSLSLQSLAIQAIIYLLWGLSLSVRFWIVASRENFWLLYLLIINVWVNCLITGAGELILLMLVIYYTYTARDNAYHPVERGEPENSVGPGATEQTPLLSQRPE